MIKPNPENEWLTIAIRELITAKATNRIAICAMLSISQPTLKSRFDDHAWKEWQVDLLCRKLKISKPPCDHEYILDGEQMRCMHCGIGK